MPSRGRLREREGCPFGKKEMTRNVRAAVAAEERPMTNKEIARAFEQIADLMDIGGENQFKTRSYRNVARTLDSYPTSLATTATEGRLREIAGVGESIAEKIEELLDTGSISFLEQLRKKYPQGLPEMLEIPGMGPKKVGLVYRELGIETIEQLARAAAQGKLRDLPGMGKKSEENILRGIAIYQEGRERALLGEALPIAEEILDELRHIEGVVAVSTAGSLRRGRETIGDLDVLAAAADSAPVMAAFKELPQIAEIILAGETKCSAYLHDGRQIDLRVVPPESFGAAQQYFTGSKAHNIALRSRAIQRKLKLNEYGVFKEETGERVAGATEEDVYAALDLPWMPPEIREDMGEIEAAEKGELPHLVEMKDIKGDLHMHTTASDGAQSLDDMIEACRARGYAYLAVTEHSQSLYVASGLKAKDLEKRIQEVHGVNDRTDDIEILVGSEVDIKSDGTLDYPDSLLDQLDVVLAALHQGFSPDAERMTGRLLAALETQRIDFVTHPTGRLIGKRDAYGLDLEAVMDAAARTKTALEVNCYPERLDLNDVNCRMAKQKGVKIAICTDAHSTSMLDYMKLGVNAQTTKALLKWLKRRK
jgi:DNA polymerase (family 10)